MIKDKANTRISIGLTAMQVFFDQFGNGHVVSGNFHTVFRP
jgi:hypothetical protein